MANRERNLLAAEMLGFRFVTGFSGLGQVSNVFLSTRVEVAAEDVDVDARGLVDPVPEDGERLTLLWRAMELSLYRDALGVSGISFSWCCSCRPCASA